MTKRKLDEVEKLNIAVVLHFIAIVIAFIGFYYDYPLLGGFFLDKFIQLLGRLFAIYGISWLVSFLPIRALVKKENAKIWFGITLIIISILASKPLENRKDRFIQKCIDADNLKVEECEDRWPLFEVLQKNE